MKMRFHVFYTIIFTGSLKVTWLVKRTLQNVVHFTLSRRARIKVKGAKSIYTSNHGSALNIFYLFPDNYSFF